MKNSHARGLARFCLYDISRSRIIRQIDAATLNQMAASGQIGWFERKGKSFPCIQPLPMQSRTSEPLFSKVSLMMTDSELNAAGAFADAKGYTVRKYGLNRFGQVDDAIVGNRVDQSMSKVEAWPETHDDRNITVCAGKVYGVREVTPEVFASL